jgi:hypothetical protein
MIAKPDLAKGLWRLADVASRSDIKPHHFQAHPPFRHRGGCGFEAVMWGSAKAFCMRSDISCGIQPFPDQRRPRGARIVVGGENTKSKTLKRQGSH